MSPTRTAPDLLSSLQDGWSEAMRQWWDQSQSAVDPWRQAWEAMMPGVAEQSAGMPSGHHRRHGSRSHHGCRSCGCESDHCANPCRCCVPDADVVVHARAGETRVIPFLLRNPWRRERDVSLVVGPWQVCGGGRVEVQAAFGSGESLTLKPCEKSVVRLMVAVRGICDDGKDPKDPKDPKDGKDPSTKDTKDGQGGGGRLGCDVESCVSAYADVRFEGCARPQRVGLVVHPASCDAVELPCECGCSCD